MVTQQPIPIGEWIKAYKQEAARAEIAIGRITSGEWSESAIKPILEGMSYAAVQHLMCEHMKFGQMFTAGRQLADWCWNELKRRDGVR